MGTHSSKEVILLGVEVEKEMEGRREEGEIQRKWRISSPLKTYRRMTVSERMRS